MSRESQNFTFDVFQNTLHILYASLTRDIRGVFEMIQYFSVRSCVACYKFQKQKGGLDSVM